MGRLLAALLSAGGATTMLAASGCSAHTDPGSPPPICSAPQGGAADAKALASGDTSFALSFFPRAVAAATAGAGQNVIVSPYSASSVLTMIDVGAAGETDAQLRATLHLPAGGASVAPAFAALACSDETAGSVDGQQLSLANAIWAQKGKSFEPGFLSALSHGYGAPLQLVDFAGDLSGAQSAIDAWVSQQTQGQIPVLLQQGDVTASSRLVAVNAVYFKGTWDTGFDASQTAPRPFTLPDETVVSVPTMSGLVNAVGTFVQETTVEVDESGTIATAASSGDSCNCGAVSEPQTVAIDQPFVFLIRDTGNGSILFIGHVEDPRQGS